MRHQPKLVASFDYPPIPTREFDWSVHDDDTYDGAPDASPSQRIMGHGRTKAEAVADFWQKWHEFHDEEETMEETVEQKFTRIANEIKGNAEWRKLLAGDHASEMKALDEIAKRYGGENQHTGGGIYVAVIRLGPHDCMGVTGECVCRYTNAETTDIDEIFYMPQNDMSGADVISLVD